MTALTVMSLIEEGRLERATTARSVLANDLPLIDDGVTVEQLLAHRSGIGDYVDEDSDLDVTDHVLPIPVHELATTEQYLQVLDGYPAKSSLEQARATALASRVRTQRGPTIVKLSERPGG
jgi:CubicO group peptidase (beta-lactamase class C family)